ncbi:hypothetical protein CAPTEDRAFT_221915 [Capitella teleta]|uniref:F5/8 type C domain-containing protein n=1 Tax=Capitella teleta TaxID=283909 RepID=R7TTU9_CAPTE|nr:hypothetical protein CAPTEDRAFT_221915 [Capitella teleta]|eukprot:ELT94440.1 hypothetical protein CAPTEDRAFT_221915 [Capitella teleta]
MPASNHVSTAKLLLIFLLINILLITEVSSSCQCIGYYEPLIINVQASQLTASGSHNNAKLQPWCSKSIAVLCLCVVIEGGKTFPKDDVLRKKWIVAIRRRDESNRGKLWSPSASSPVCQKHFTEDVFIKTNQADMIGWSANYEGVCNESLYDYWIEVDFLKNKLLAGIVTWGRATLYDQFVASFHLEFLVDKSNEWTNITENGTTVMFTANTNRQDAILNTFSKSLLLPIQVFWSSNIAMGIHWL